MKKTVITISALALAFCFNIKTTNAQTVEDANVSLSNLNTNSWFDSYDDNTKTVNNLNFEVLSDGNNSNNLVTPFTVKVYIWDGSTPHFVKTYNVSNMNEMSSLDYSGETVDLSSLGLPAGTYRLGVYVDADDAIPNPPDDPSDNAFLLQGDINYTPGGPTSIKNLNGSQTNLSIYPNPATNKLNVALENNCNKVVIKNVTGQMVKEINVSQNQKNITIDISNLSNGIYFLSAQSESSVTTTKFVKQ